MKFSRYCPEFRRSFVGYVPPLQNGRTGRSKARALTQILAVFLSTSVDEILIVVF